MRPAYKSYRQSYTGDSPIIIFYECQRCKRKWYSTENNIGFLICPYENEPRYIVNKIDTTSGSLGLERFDGQGYSTNL